MKNKKIKRRRLLSYDDKVRYEKKLFFLQVCLGELTTEIFFVHITKFLGNLTLLFDIKMITMGLSTKSITPNWKNNSFWLRD